LNETVRLNMPKALAVYLPKVTFAVGVALVGRKAVLALQKQMGIAAFMEEVIPALAKLALHRPRSDGPFLRRWSSHRPPAI